MSKRQVSQRRGEGNLGVHLGMVVSTAEDMLVTGHRFDVYENGVDHAEECPCVNYVLPGEQ